jgi:HSP20 family protein
MPILADPFELLLRLQQALDSSRTSDWLEPGPSAGGSFPAINAFRKGDDYVLLAEAPGINRADLDIQLKGRTLHLSGTKPLNYPDKAGLHRRERPFGRFDRAITLPFEVDPDKVQASYQDGILAVLLPRAERDKPRRIALT